METHKIRKFFRSGDHAFHSVEHLPEGEVIKHNGRFVFGVGEASNHNHVITVERPQDLEIIKTKDGFYFNLKADGKLSHEIGNSRQKAEHEVITIRKGLYFQVPERETDIFTSVVRKVID